MNGPLPVIEAADRSLLNLAQEGLPLVRRPFEALAEGAGLSEADALDHLRALKQQGILRQVGAIFDTRLIGYQSCLAAMRIAPGRIDEAAAIVSAHPGVSHNYERPAEFNLWLTLAVPPGRDLKRALADLADAAGALDHALLPAVRIFKIGVKLDMQESAEPSRSAPAAVAPVRSAASTPVPDVCDREFIRILQEPLELVPQPWDALAERLQVTPPEALEWLHKAQARGWLRRVGALLKHRQAGFSANGMCLWKAGDRLEEGAALLGSFNAVSHCYERAKHPAWPYDLYAMVHGRAESEVQAVADRLTPLLGPARILYSTREFKKTRLRYFCEESAS